MRRLRFVLAASVVGLLLSSCGDDVEWSVPEPGCHQISDDWFGCNADSDCSSGCACTGGLFDGECVPGCRSNADCPAHTYCPARFCFFGCGAPTQCSPGCHDDSECSSGLSCLNGDCVVTCELDEQCELGQSCFTWPGERRGTCVQSPDGTLISPVSDAADDSREGDATAAPDGSSGPDVGTDGD